MRSIIILFAVVALWVCAAFPALADDSDKNEGEYRVRVALLYNFLKFVNWPGESSPVKSGTANVCIIGDKGFSAYFAHFNSLSNVRRQSPAINIRDTNNNLKSCHIVFVGNDAASNLGALLAQTKHSHVLSISEIQGFADNGGIIEIANDPPPINESTLSVRKWGIEGQFHRGGKDGKEALYSGADYRVFASG